jgi:hypothetical protein
MVAEELMAEHGCARPGCENTTREKYCSKWCAEEDYRRTHCQSTEGGEGCDEEVKPRLAHAI